MCVLFKWRILGVLFWLKLHKLNLKFLCNNSFLGFFAFFAPF